MNIVFAPTFLRRLKKYPPTLRGEVFEKVAEFRDVNNHKKLKVHKLNSNLEIYSFSVNYKIRIIFEYQNSTKANFLTIGSHNDVY